MNPEICVLWAASDVLMCSASIWHMCTMSMDRYFTLKYPMRYGRNKTRRMVAGKILFVWVVSMAISSPVCIYGFIDTANVFQNGECVPTLKNFVIYGSIFAFYIPLLIMILTYVLTIRILWKNQLRMKNIDRSNLKPRLAQLTAQCTGLAIPRLLTSLRKPIKSPCISSTKSKKQLLEAGSTGGLNNKISGNVNDVVSEAEESEDVEGGRGKSNMVVTYLAPPSPQTFISRSPSPSSAQMPPYSDTEESESEPNYFSLLRSNHSCRSLCTPISLTTSKKSLQKRLHKKQLYQQQQQELQLLQHNYHQQHLNCNTSPLKEKTNFSTFDKTYYLPSESSPPLSPLFDEETANHQQLPLLIDPCGPTPFLQSSPLTPKLSRKSSSNNSTSSNTFSKKKRYSKRCKKRRNSLTQSNEKTDHLKVPGEDYFRHGLSAKHSGGHANMLCAVSDTHVSKAGRGVKSDDEEYNITSPFLLGHCNLNKDYKSAEWDRRYFQIQEEMDRCLEGEFSRSEQLHSKTLQDLALPNNRPDKVVHKTVKKAPEMKALLKPEVSLPLYLPHSLNCDGNFLIQNGYSHSAPNSPLNRRNSNFMKLTSSSDDEREDDGDNENTSDKNDDDYDNDTIGSSNSDVIKIRLHPPTPKTKSSGSLNVSRAQVLDNTTSLNCINTREQSIEKMLNQEPLSDDAQTHHDSSISDHLNGFPHISYDTDSSSCNNNTVSYNIKTGTSVQSLSSPIPELVISSEGEMTLEETDDTLDDSPKHQRIKLRRPCQINSLKNKDPKNNPTQGNDLQKTKPPKKKQPSFRNTFRIHKGKGTVKHILSKKTASNEKKASKVLGIIFLVFVVLWTPFFALNILNATCEACMGGVSKEIMSLFLWMGYVASLANPIIYTMFNTAFRRTFIKILTCKIQRTCRIKTSDTPHMSYTTMLASERRNTMTVVLRDESK